MPAEFVIFDFDGTLFDTHQAISHSIKLTFDTLLPESTPLESEVQKLIGGGWGLQNVLRTLHPSPSSFNEDEWVSTYRRIYNDHGQKLVSPFAGAKELLENLSSRGIPIAIISNKGVAAVEAALENNSLENFIPRDLIIGDNTPGATRKPDPGSFANVLKPALSARGFPTDLDMSKVLVVGDTEADLKFASNIGGAKSIWCRFGYGDKEKCENLGPGFKIDELSEVEKIVNVL
ncbi:phosphoglycolate phosphatase [Fusarium longipes]|uniref:Phosphoglycolate phosphatase n=1 Tax=Fusarium longipes TaxID=694270 RepID=A0A395SWC6_9HYPO|nr:phosphoglycolate phosphatase [Fusarium longipes]